MNTGRPLSEFLQPAPAIDYGSYLAKSSVGRSGGTSGFGDPRSKHKWHRGVDTGLYKLQSPRAKELPECDGRFFCPSKVIPALAIGFGHVGFAGWRNDRYSVWIDHHYVPGFGPLVSFYTHLASVFVTKGQEVTQATPIGIIGATGTDLNHLHHEWWFTALGKSYDDWTSVDPEPYLLSLGFAVIRAPVGPGPGGSWGISGYRGPSGGSPPPYPKASGLPDGGNRSGSPSLQSVPFDSIMDAMDYADTDRGRDDVIAPILFTGVAL